MTIQITDGPSVMDPLGIAPIQVTGLPGRLVVPLAAIGWRARLAVWLLRQYVDKCVSAR